MPPRSNTLQDVFDYYQKKIQSAYSEKEAKTILYQLFEDFFGITRLDLCLNPERRLSESEIVQVYDAVALLRKNVPVQYITQSSVFCGHPLKVDSSTLIPRPETEELVQLVSKHIHRQGAKILDIGTGSGAIAIALKKQHPDSCVFACDISESALNMARFNAQQLKADIHFFACDILSEDIPFPSEMFDIIVSNPPYIPISEKKDMAANVVQYEPSIALFVADDQPLIFYEAIVRLANRQLVSDGQLFFEVHEHFAAQVLSLLHHNGFCHEAIQKDVFEKDRMVFGKKSNV